MTHHTHHHHDDHASQQDEQLVEAGMQVRTAALQDLEDAQSRQDKHEGGVKLVVCLPWADVVCNTHQPHSHLGNTCV